MRSPGLQNIRNYTLRIGAGARRPQMNILDPRFKYVNSESTDIRKTFARIRRKAQADATTSTRINVNGASVRALPSSRKSVA